MLLNSHKIMLGAFALALACTPTLRAANFDFHVELNVSSLIGQPNSPFFLDFQLNEGSGSLANSVTISNFAFTGGSATGSGNAFGNASGDLGSSVTLNDNPSSPFNEFFQGFSTSTTKIGFNVSLSQNSPGATPDGFVVSILDSENNNPQIATDAPDGISLLIAPIKSVETIGDVQTYSSTSPAGVTTFAAVPEPNGAVAFAGAFALLLGIARRRRTLAV